MWRSSSCTFSRGVMVAWLLSGLLGMSVLFNDLSGALPPLAGEGGPEGRMRALFVKSRTLTPTPLPWTGGGLQAVSELFNDDVAVGVDADVAGDLERFGGDGLRVESGVRKQRARGGQRERAAGADRDQTILWFDHVTGAADDQRGVLVGHRQQRLELSEAALGAPVLGQFHRGARELAVLFELGFEQLEQRER